MSVDVSERAFEDAIEAALLRREGVIAGGAVFLSSICRPADIRSVSPRTTTRPTVLSHATCWTSCWQPQPREWKRLSEHHGTMVEEQFLKRLAAEIGRRGALDVLAHRNQGHGMQVPARILPPSERVERRNQASARRQPLLGRPTASLQ